MQNTKMISMLDTIPRQKPVSKYSKELKKVFCNQSLNDLVYTLKNPKHYKPQLFLEVFNEKYPKYPSKYSEEILNEALVINKREKDNRFSNSKLRKKIIEISQSNVKKKRHLESLKDTPDPFRYKPNYNAIYKNSYSVILKSADNSKREKSNTQCSSIVLPVINNEDNQYQFDQDQYQYQYQYQDQFPKEQKEIDYNYIKTPSNHALKFNQYTIRKGIFQKKDYDDRNEVVVVNWKDRSEIKAPDFSKMKHRPELSLVNTSVLGNPTSVHYHPNYSLVSKHSPEIKFSNEKPVLTKKFLVRKLWSNYHVESGYHLVNLK